MKDQTSQLPPCPDLAPSGEAMAKLSSVVNGGGSLSPVGTNGKLSKVSLMLASPDGGFKNTHLYPQI